MKKIAIIGCGQATYGFFLGLMDRQDIIDDLLIDVYDQNEFGNSGLVYDGKLVLGPYAGTQELIDIELQTKILNYYLSHANIDNTIDVQDIVQSIQNTKRDYQHFYQSGLYMVPQYTYHLGTDQLQNMNRSIINSIKANKKYKIKFHFNTRLEPQISLQDSYDMVIYAVGRRGTTLLKKFESNPEYIESNNKVDLGIRFELPASLHDIAALDKQRYQWKIQYKTSNNLKVRTFCHNPKGFVTMQNVQVLGDKIQIVNGHSFANRHSENTNFAILVSHQFTEPFEDSILYGKIISQLANLLAGRDKVILQTLGDFIKNKRTKKLFRVHPTLPAQNYILGDLSYVFPTKTYEALVQFLTVLGQRIPSVLYPDNLLYGVQTKFYSTVFKNTDRVKFIGDCGGKSRSIIAATSSGYRLGASLSFS